MHHIPSPDPPPPPCFHPPPPHASSAGPSTPAGPLPQRATRPSPTAIFHAPPSLAPCPARRGPFASHLRRRAAPAGPRARPPLRLCRVRQSVSSPVGTASQDPIFHPASHLPAAARLPSPAAARLPPPGRRGPPFPGRRAPPFPCRRALSTAVRLISSLYGSVLTSTAPRTQWRYCIASFPCLQVGLLLSPFCPEEDNIQHKRFTATTPGSSPMSPSAIHPCSRLPFHSSSLGMFFHLTYFKYFVGYVQRQRAGGKCIDEQRDGGMEQLTQTEACR
ncbi:classical arabinogalactan protein 9-like isoform X3 [Triticum urartu]|uniref:classical arabinogalactan protein 9-like isoform X3 n=1 Tax=Triticum urartu TaxID=4572 RepID=UPI0020440E35|nr:classical arabinogalactan protein 9-like isoform X3 [Triticum urartu]XP_048547038.1 classical arabinogalactan protein 9-like isoform X3 [Triticum urartu]